MEHNPQATFVSKTRAPKVFGRALPKASTGNPMSWYEWVFAALIAVAAGYVAVMLAFPVGMVQTVVTSDGTAYTVTTQLADDVDVMLEDFAFVMAKNVCPTTEELTIRKAYRCAEFGL